MFMSRPVLVALFGENEKIYVAMQASIGILFFNQHLQKHYEDLYQDFTLSLLILLCHGDQPKGEWWLQMINQKKLIENGLN